MQDLIYPERFQNVTVGPLLKGSSKHSFIFNVRPFDIPLVHLRQRGQQLVDASVRSSMNEADAHEAVIEEGPVIYAGPFIEHFGHFVAECIHQLYPKTIYPELCDAKVAFHSANKRPLHLPGWAIDVLSLFNILPNEVLAINKPITFKNLFVPTQGRVLSGPSLFKSYANLLPVNTSLFSGSPEKSGAMYYVSRLKHIYSGSFLGESLIEQCLSKVGFTILYPEEIPTIEMVHLLRSAEVAIFSEGSAIHNLELCGRTDVKVFVIGRRKGSFDRFRFLLDDFAADWRIFEQFVDGVPLDWDAGRNKPSRQRACSYVKIDVLLSEISAFVGKSIPIPSAREIETAMRYDLAQFILDPRTTRNQTSNEHLGELLRMLRSQFDTIQASWVGSEG